MTTKTKNVKGSKNTDTKKTSVKTIAQNTITSVKEAISKLPIKKVEPEMFGLYLTTYHYWRNWVKDIFKEKKIVAKFIRDDKGFGGTIFILKSETDKIKKTLKEYSEKHTDEVDLWW